MNLERLDYSQKKCLIVEDQRPFSALLKGLLSDLGAQKIMTELSAENAIKTCKKNNFDIVICDLHLGSNRKNGFEFLEEIRKTKLIPTSAVFIMISADSSRSMVLGSLEKQPDDYLIKPFSQAQLSTRVARAANRRTALNALYSQIEHGDYALAVSTCKHFLEVGSKYTKQLIQLLVQLYWKLEDFQKAEQVLEEILEQRELHWAVSSMAKTQLLMGNNQKAIELGKKAINHSKNNAEAHDIVAEACLGNEMKSQALAYIQDAMSLSPFSIERHFKVCKIARANKKYELAMESSQAIWELSQRSVHRNINHLCSYIRSILDVAEHSTDKQEKNKYKQEAMLVLNRSKSDESYMRENHDFDFDSFESLINSRINFLDGKHTEAKKSLEEAQVMIEEKFSDFPLPLAPDSIKSMVDLGDFEEASRLIDKLKPEELDPNIESLIEHEQTISHDRKSDYVEKNKQGIEFYSCGKYQEAYQMFKEAKDVSPTNLGVTLNLLECITKILKSAANSKTNTQLIKECNEHYKYITSIPLRDRHKRKFETFKSDAEYYLTN